MRLPLTEMGYTWGLIAAPIVFLFLWLFNANRMGKIATRRAILLGILCFGVTIGLTIALL